MKNLYFFGLAYYNKLVDMADRVSEKLKRPLDLLYEHKLLMSRRLDFLYQNKYMIDSDYGDLRVLYDNVSKLSLTIRNGYIKYQINPSEILLGR